MKNIKQLSYFSRLHTRKHLSIIVIYQLSFHLSRNVSLFLSIHKTKRHHSVITERRHSVTFQSLFSRLNGRYITVTIQWPFSAIQSPFHRLSVIFTSFSYITNMHYFWVSRITEITGNYLNHQKITDITSKRTKITGTSCRYMFSGFKNVTYITVSNMRMILSKNMWKKTKKPEVAILFLLDAELWRVHARY